MFLFGVYVSLQLLTQEIATKSGTNIVLLELTPLCALIPCDQ
jgi:hypothetical protein